MLIKEIRIIRLRAPWVEAPKFGPVVPETREILMVEIETRSGVIGTVSYTHLTLPTNREV